MYVILPVYGGCHFLKGIATFSKESIQAESKFCKAGIMCIVNIIEIINVNQIIIRRNSCQKDSSEC